MAEQPRGVVDRERGRAEKADEDEREEDQDLALAGLAIARLVRRDLTPVMSARRRVPATGRTRIIRDAGARGRGDL